ncbi:MAG: hypothetical protein QM756_12660 [Polyangiaceae bacterium]
MRESRCPSTLPIRCGSTSRWRSHVAHVRRKSFGVTGAIFARLQATARSRRTLPHAVNSKPSVPSAYFSACSSNGTPAPTMGTTRCALSVFVPRRNTKPRAWSTSSR